MERETDQIATDRNAVLVQLHVAEYQALTARNTNFITLLYALWSLLVVAVALVAQLHGVIVPHALVWTILWLVNLSVVWYFGITVAAYDNVRYLECELRPVVAKLVGRRDFWQYETYLAARRAIDVSIWEQSPVALGIAACLFGAFWSRFTSLLLDASCLGVCLITLYSAILLSRVAVRVRRDFTACTRRTTFELS